MALPSGTRLGPYEILSAIGAGGMGEVYKARDTRLGRDVAIKVLPAGATLDPERRRRFELEARAVSALNHPHICVLHDIGSQDGVDFLVMEHVEGPTLAQQLRKGPLPRAQVLEFGAQVADALATAHRRGVVHRDLKPANIMLTKAGAKLLDFGLAKLKAEPSAAGVGVSAISTQAPATRPGAVMGTVPYMAPEQLEGKETDARTDLFALGCVIYEMLTARRAFDGDTEASVISAIMTGAPPPLSTLQPPIPPALDRLVRRCLAKDPDDRWQHAADVAEELRGISQDALAPASGRTALRVRRAWVFRAVALCIVVLVGGIAIGTGVYLSRARDGEPVDSIAVLPFVNVSGDPETEYLSEGIPESLNSALTQLPNLRVLPSSMVARFKGTGIDIEKAGRELKVRAIVTGRIMQHGDSLTVSTELTDAQDVSLISGRRYDGRLTDVLALQEEIANGIAEKLRPRLTAEGKAQLATSATKDNQAYQLYLRGRYFWSKRSLENLERAITCFKQAVERDPGYALAYAGLADCQNLLSYYGGPPPEKTFPLAKEAARLAIRFDAKLAGPHAAMAYAATRYDWDWSEAEREYKIAIGLDPKYATAHQWYGEYLTVMGRSEEAIAEFKHATELEPYSLIINATMALPYVYARRFDEAIEIAQRSVELEPSFPLAHRFLALGYVGKRMYQDALRESQLAFDLSGRSPHYRLWLAYVDALADRGAEAQAALKAAGATSDGRYVTPYGVAQVFAGLGDPHQAVAWLERAYEQRDERLMFLKVDAAFDPLRSVPRFQALLRKMNFPS